MTNPYPIRPDDKEVSAQLEQWWKDIGRDAIRLSGLARNHGAAHSAIVDLAEMAFRAGYIRGLNAPPTPTNPRKSVGAPLQDAEIDEACR